MCVFYLFITYVCVLPFYNLCVFYLLPPRRNLMLLCAEWENKKQNLTYTRKPCPKSTLQTVHTHRVGQKRTCTPCIGLARTIYIRCMYGIFGRGITKYTVIYDVYTRFWPTLKMLVLHKEGGWLGAWGSSTDVEVPNLWNLIAFITLPSWVCLG